MVLYALISAGVLGGIAAAVLEARLGDRDARLAELLEELEQREILRHEQARALATLRRELVDRDARLQRLDTDNERLAAALDRALAERLALEDERNFARERARRLDQGASEARLRLETAERERLAMDRERAALEVSLQEAVAAAEEAHHREQVLRWRLEDAQALVVRLEHDNETRSRWLAEWLDERADVIERILDYAGLEPTRRLAGNGPDSEAGQGGPLLPMDMAATPGLPEPGYGVPARMVLGPSLPPGFSDAYERLAVAERLLAAVPLAAPVDHYRLTSRFGVRIDPITRRQAQHNGLDFGAASGSQVLATAPGRVTRAGRAGSYGIMVEIDHDHGIMTRYAHLSRTMVEAGDRVATGEPIGIIGSTGRSTGRHLHYEVHLDGRPIDPARFIAAGRQLIGLLGS